MEHKQKSMLCMNDTTVIKEYNAKDIITIKEKEICFSDGYVLDLMKCKQFFPIEELDGQKYVGARLSGEYWQFFVEQGSVMILCDNMEDYCEILSKVGFVCSFDLS